MNNRAAFALIALIATPLAGQASRDVSGVHHTLSFDHGMPTAHVEMRVEGIDRERLEVAMPIWKPGSYRVLNFARHIESISAVDGEGKDLSVTKTGESSWAMPTAAINTVTISYELDMSRRGIGRQKRLEIEGRTTRQYPAYLLEGPQTWLYVPGRLDVEHRASFDLPAGWGVATGMRPTADPKSFTCPDYDVLADCPVHMGKFEKLGFDVGGKKHEVILSGFERDDNDREALVERWRKIVLANVDMWGELPYDRYVFLTGYPGGGGLEHLNSTNMTMMNLSGSREDHHSMWDSLVSHEYFHLWNVKRLRPKALGPFDYADKEANRTRYLWVSEGITSYYGDLLCVRAGLWDPERYWTSNITSEINSLQRNPGRLKVSVAEASWTVWDFPYMRRGMTAPNYYNKGQLLGMLLDIEIRDATNNRKSLDDVMRELYRQCMESNSGFADGDLQKWCEEISGRSFEEFFVNHVEGTQELPFTEVLAKVGIHATPAETSTDEDSRRRRSRGRWKLSFQKDASKRAVEIREDITRLVIPR